MTTGTALADAERSMAAAEVTLRDAVVAAYPIGMAVILRYAGGTMQATVVAHEDGRNCRKIGVHRIVPWRTNDTAMKARLAARVWWHDYRALWPA